jgi:hypothetical protein
MNSTQKLFLSADEYVSDHDYFDSHSYKHHSVSIEIDSQEPYFEITYKSEKNDSIDIYSYEVYLYAEPRSQEALIELLDFLVQGKPTDESETDVYKMQLNRGHYRDHRNDYKKNVNYIQFHAKWNRLIIETLSGENPLIPYYSELRSNGPVNRDNLEKLQSYAEKIISDYRKNDMTELPELNSVVKNELFSIKYGEAVLDHLSDADQCFHSDLFLPALSSYIHAIEWTAIAYLEAESDIDIIEKEKQGGGPYYFANRDDSVISELKSHASVDQKTISKIESMNRAERRWIAHHKSGEVLESEILAVRERLFELLNQLYC